MFLLDERTLVTSASDLTLASKCEFAFLRTLDLKLGRIDGVPVNDDAMLKRAGELGDQHELRVAEEYKQTHPEGVVEIERPYPLTRESLRQAADDTRAAFGSGADVVYQATFFDETDADNPFIGFADFIVKIPDGADGITRYRVQDTKLARRAKVTALLQLAAYHEQLERIGVPTDETVELILGDGSSSLHRVDEIVPVFRNRRQRLTHIIAEHRAEPGYVEWGDDRYTIDGRCEHCAAEVEAHRDLLMVAGIRVTQRAKLHDVGIRTLDDLASTPVRPAECALPDRTYRAIHAQAALQASARPADPDDPHAAPPFDLFAPQVMADLPLPDAGDIFFDFEGDPLYREPGDENGPNGARESRWNLDYLFGLVDNDEVFTSFWAHDLAEEKLALIDFLQFVRLRRQTHPGMHIYHYASYERTHLLSIAARHGVAEHIVDELLRDGVLVDLYPVVKKSLRIGGRSYSIKKLEPLYMGDEHRTDDGVTNALDSVQEYARSRELLAAGAPGEAQHILDQIADYNRYDCVSTLRLRDWLLARAAEHGVVPGAVTNEEPELALFEPTPLSVELLRHAEEAGWAGHPDAAETYRLAAAAIDYHQREAKSYWWEHFTRLTDPIELWDDTRGVFAVSSVTIEADWALGERQRIPHRLLRAEGAWAPGSSALSGSGSGTDAFALYEDPPPFTKLGRRAGSRLDVNVRVRADPDDATAVFIEETCPQGESPWSGFPVAVTPGPPPRATSLVAAIELWGWRVANAAPRSPEQPAVDILRRRPPRLRGEASGAVLEPMADADDGVRAVVKSVLALKHSYLAVQGPPGTGKTYLAAHVIAELVRDHQWKVGVVAQSHKVIENVLSGVVEAGLTPDLVAKAAPSDPGPGAYADAPFTELERDTHAAFARTHADSGYVIGGTSWDFTNRRRTEQGQYDLLVIDEAGQFSLAATIAVSVSARTLLLLGDPQQLPQVSQGIHPAPVDESALGWISAGHDVLPPNLGYFLAESRRMDAAVTLPVSRLAYDGALRSNADTASRTLRDVEPGLHPLSIAHRDNSTSSPEEAAAVVELAQSHLGRLWTNPDAARTASPLTERDIIVVTPYNAQVELISEHLTAAGLLDIRVGTVDKFQGQEAVISIVSLAASSPDDVPRGLSFLLSRNRLNVAISRAQWAAYLIYSLGLLDHLPEHPEGVAELSRFIELVSR